MYNIREPVIIRIIRVKRQRLLALGNIKKNSLSAVLLILILTLSGCEVILPFSKEKATERVSDLSAGSVFVDIAEIRSRRFP